MISPSLGVGLTTTLVYRCQPPQSVLGGCNTVATRRPLDLVVTRDGGRTWATSGRPVPVAAQPKAAEFVALAFGSSTSGYVMVGGELLFTADAGSSWQRLAVPGRIESLTPVATTAWVVLSDCPPDAPATAPCPTRIAQTTPSGGLIDQHTVAATVDPVGTPTSKVAVFINPESTASLLITVDAGRTWSDRPNPCPVGAPSLTGTGAPDWWALCSHNIGMHHAYVDVYETTDGWATWTLKAAASPQGQSTGGLNATEGYLTVSPDGRRLWIVGVNQIQTSTDGGRTWADVAGVNLSGWPAYLDTLAPERAWVSAGNQGLWATADGSRWRALGPTGIPGS